MVDVDEGVEGGNVECLVIVYGIDYFWAFL